MLARSPEKGNGVGGSLCKLTVGDQCIIVWGTPSTDVKESPQLQTNPSTHREVYTVIESEAPNPNLKSRGEALPYTENYPKRDPNFENYP